MSSGSVDSPSGDSISSPELPEAAVISLCSLAVARGSSLTLWHGLDQQVDTTPERQLQLSPDRPAIIGRSEGHEVHYMDPSYRATRLVPGTGQNIMHSGGDGSDMFVSRGHFMLRASGRGVLLVKGAIHSIPRFYAAFAIGILRIGL
jgi:hypothetical protein